MTLKDVKYIQLDDKEGKLYAAGKQSVMVPITFVSSMDAMFKKLVGRDGADTLIYKVGEALGRGYSQSLQAILDKEGMEIGLESRVQMSCNAIFMEAGWGSIKILDMDLKQGMLNVKITHSPSMDLLGAESFSLERGALSGLFHEMTGQEVHCNVIQVDKETNSVFITTTKNFPDEWKEKEKVVLISRKELHDKNEELKQALSILQQTQKQLIQSEKMATIGILAGGVAHEINTPLGTILLSAESLGEEALNDENKQLLGMIVKNTTRCKHIVEQLLAYSRESKDGFVPLSLCVLIKETLQMLSYDFSKYGIVYKIHCTKEGTCDREGLVVGNQNELQQVFTNLIVNAVDSIKEKFHDTNGMGGVIEVECFKDVEDCFIVEFKDNGKGIKAENIKMIFDPFFTTKEVGKGTGLGLSVLFRIIEKHGGTITVNSEYGDGAVFRISFPLNKT